MSKRICIVGAGVVGVTSAYALARAGHTVSLIDAQAHAAQGSSFANGGQLSYSYVAPLASPGIWRDVPAWMLRGDSPLQLRLRRDPRQWRWLSQFLLACRSSVARTATAHMLALAYLSRDTLHGWLAQHPLEFDLTRSGKLIVYRDAQALAKAGLLTAYQRELGAEQQMLDAAQTVALEPALAPQAATLAGAIYTPSEETADCMRFTQGLCQAFLEQPGAHAYFNTQVHGLRCEGSRVVALQTSQGDIEADAYVVAAGLDSARLLEPLGQPTGLYGLKGYSLTVDVDPAQSAAVPRISVTDYQRRIVYARLNGSLRIAAMIDMGADSTAADPRRIALLKQQVGDMFPALNLERARIWAGQRPATPSGKPRIGRSRIADNLWLNVGQGALGFTLASGSAALLQAQMDGLPTAIDAAPFLP